MELSGGTECGTREECVATMMLVWTAGVEKEGCDGRAYRVFTTPWDVWLEASASALRDSCVTIS